MSFGYTIETVSILMFTNWPHLLPLKVPHCNLNLLLLLQNRRNMSKYFFVVIKHMCAYSGFWGYKLLNKTLYWWK